MGTIYYIVVVLEYLILEPIEPDSTPANTPNRLYLHNIID